MKTYLGLDAPLPDNDTPPHPIDIVAALGRTRRFGGWGSTEWTVLHHTVLSYMLYVRSFGPAGAMHMLAHDMHEAYTGDIPSPVKNLLGREEVKDLENHLDERIYLMLGVSRLKPGSTDEYLVKVCDTASLIVEAWYFGPQGAGRAAFAGIGKTNWTTIETNKKRDIARVIRQSCPEVYEAMLETPEYHIAASPDQPVDNSWIPEIT